MAIIGNIYGFLGYNYHVRGLLDKAEAFYKKAEKAHMTRGNYRLAYGILLLNKGDYKKSRDVLGSLLIELPSSAKTALMAKTNLALTYWKLGDIDTSIEMLWEVHRKQRRSMVYGALGLLLVLKGDLETAIKFNMEALEYDEEDPIILNNIAQNYYRMGEKEKARKYFLKSVAVKEDLTDALFYLACMDNEKGNLESARTRLKKALNSKTIVLSSISKDDIEEKLKSLE